MKNGIQLRCDPDFHDFLLRIQQERGKLDNDKIKSKASLTFLTHLCFKILQRKKNVEELLTRRF